MHISPLSVFYHQKDNVIKDVHGRWTIEKTCDTVTLESRHPLFSSSGDLGFYGDFFIYNQECNEDEIVYFKVDFNMIEKLPNAYLGLLAKSNSFIDLISIM